MRITKDTSYEQLKQLRKSFAPRWETEAAKVKEARATLTGEALAQAEQAYADFETVATAVIAMTQLRQIYEADLVKWSEPAATEERTPEERDRRAQGHYSGPDMTPGDNTNRAPTQGEIFNRLEQELKADFHDLLKNKVTPELEAAYQFARKRSWNDASHCLEHAEMYIVPILRRYDAKLGNLNQLSAERKEAFMQLPEQQSLQKLCNDCKGINLAVECANENSGFQNGFKKNPPHNTRSGRFRTFQDVSGRFRTFQDVSGRFRTFQDVSGRFRTKYPHIDIVKRPFDYVNTPAH